MASAQARRPGDLSTLKSGLDALLRDDLAAARKALDRLPVETLDRRILAWAIARSGLNGVSSDEIGDALRQLAGWPRLADLQANRERALLRENPPPHTVLAAFANTQPRTYEGAVILARAHVALENPEAARAVLSPLWRNEALTAGEERTIIGEFGELLGQADHRARMEYMLHKSRIGSAEQVAKLAQASALAEAWAAVIRGRKNAGTLLDRVPAAQRSAGYLFAKARHLRRQEQFDKAAAVMLSAPRGAADLADPDAWWIERRALSRELFDLGQAKTAYRIAAGHAAESAADMADAEFHAGWYALRGLKDALTAARHFGRIAEIAGGPISRARAYYWLGRAAEAGGPGTAEAFYGRAAVYGTAFYGQLAAAKLGRETIAAAPPAPAEAERQAFAQREAVQAITRLERAGHGHRAYVIYRALAQELTSPGEVVLLTAMARKRGDNHLALRVGKIAALRGVEIGALAHPLGAVPSSADLSAADEALTHAVARQESEFNTGAVSGAGARGLLQLLPGTARDMAKKHGLPYARQRLTSDAAYNAALGAAYLGEQLERFSGSYVLTFAGYNAGPRRAEEWVARHGDPRAQPVDNVVDWIERIPYAETRNYVQRVMENYQVYKMRLEGRFDIVGDLVKGRP